MIMLFPDGDGAGGNNNAGGGNGAGNGTGEGGGDSIASRILGQTALRDALNPPREIPTEGQPQPAKEPPAWKKETDALAAKQTALDMENRQLRGIIQGLRQAAPTQQQLTQQQLPVAPKVQKTDAQLAEELRANPIGTLRSIMSEREDEMRTQIREEIKNETAGVRNSVAANDRVRSAFEQERGFVNDKFPVQTNTHGHFNQTFHDEMRSEWNTIVERDGMQLYPGQLKEAATNVALRWAEQGKSWVRPGGGGGNGTGGGAGTSPTEIRNVSRTTVVTGSSPGGGRQGGGGRPTTIAELGLSGEEAAAAHEIVRKWNSDPARPFTEKMFVDNYLAASEEVPNFGQG